MGKKLEVGTNICLLIASVFVVGLLCYNQFFSMKPNVGHQLVGQSVDAKTFGPSQGDRALVLLLSTQCKYCAASVPFYRELARSSSGRNLTAAFVQPEDQARQYLEEHQLDFKRIVGSTTLIRQIPSTPTILLIDGSGKILDAWIGRLPPDQRQEVLRHLPL